MKFTIDVERIDILSRKGTDLILVYFNGTTPLSWCLEEKPCFQIEVTKNHGEQWVKENFPGMEYKILVERS
jgi:hypothetical protein